MMRLMTLSVGNDSENYYRSNLGKTDFINRKFRCRLGGARDCCQLPTTGDALAAHIQRAGLYIHPPRAS